MTRQLNLGVLGSAVLHDILQSLPYDPKQAQTHVPRDLSLDVTMEELDSQLVSLREFSAEAPYASRETQNVQLGWMKLVGQVVDTGRNFRGYFHKVVQLLPDLRRKAGHILFEFRVQYA